MTYNIEFTFVDPFNAQPFVIMLMQSGITDLTMKTSDNDGSCRVTYEVDECNIDPDEAIKQDLIYIADSKLNAISFHKYAKQQVSTTMTKEEFKRRWERNDRTNPITFDDIAKCAIEWGVCEKPRTRPLSRVRYEVLVAAGVSDAEEFNPDNYEED
ncbi:MAG: hypothetical protein J6V21_02050 [Alistipes sp.]|nr:hypothetical protein [Alistipes sp.]